jgi:Zn-dependent membrane protease YugP
MLILISIVFTVIGMILSGTLRSKFSRYSKVPLTNGMSGADVAATMLRHYGIQDVQVIHVEGELTDHYNPATKTVNLSQDVYHGRNVAAAAVAAHECGHAVQHATAYSMLQLRSALVPIVNIAASLQQYLFMMALVGMSMFNNQYILLVVLIVFGITCFFSLVTLPVEFDASRRALAWLDTSGVAARGEQYDGAKDALFWAAMTYVAAALAALLQFVYLLMKFLGNRE